MLLADLNGARKVDATDLAIVQASFGANSRHAALLPDCRCELQRRHRFLGFGVSQPSCVSMRSKSSTIRLTDPQNLPGSYNDGKKSG
jgi:hypothetical protein